MTNESFAHLSLIYIKRDTLNNINSENISNTFGENGGD